MLVGHGIDKVEIKRIEISIKMFGGRFIDRIYTGYERSLCDRGVDKIMFQRYAGYWSLKKQR